MKLESRRKSFIDKLRDLDSYFDDDYNDIEFNEAIKNAEYSFVGLIDELQSILLINQDSKLIVRKYAKELGLVLENKKQKRIIFLQEVSAKTINLFDEIKEHDLEVSVNINHEPNYNELVERYWRISAYEKNITEYVDAINRYKERIAILFENLELSEEASNSDSPNVLIKLTLSEQILLFRFLGEEKLFPIPKSNRVGYNKYYDLYSSLLGKSSESIKKAWAKADTKFRQADNKVKAKEKIKSLNKLKSLLKEVSKDYQQIQSIINKIDDSISKLDKI